MAMDNLCVLNSKGERIGSIIQNHDGTLLLKCIKPFNLFSLKEESSTNNLFINKLTVVNLLYQSINEKRSCFGHGDEYMMQEIFEIFLNKLNNCNCV